MGRGIQPAQTETETLKRLQLDEAKLTLVLDAQREAAAQVERNARAEAARIRNEARRATEQELAGIRDDAERILSYAVAELQAVTDRRIEALRQQAQQGREQAIAFILDVVLGKAAP